MLATIAGGTQLHVPLTRGGAALTNEAGIQINTANIVPAPEKKIAYVFAFTDSRGRTLRSVRVEDVSDEAAVVLVDDAEPKLSGERQWHSTTPPLEFSDPWLRWLATISNSLRVFRFTLTFSDG